MSNLQGSLAKKWLFETTQSRLTFIFPTDFVQNAKVTPSSNFDRDQIVKRKSLTSFGLFYLVQLLFRNVGLPTENQPIALVYFDSLFENDQLPTIFFYDHLIVGKEDLLIFGFILHNPELALFRIE